MHDRQDLRQRAGLVRAERPHGFIAVQQGVHRVGVGGRVARFGQVKPGDGAAFQRGGEIVDRERPVGQAEVHHPGHRGPSVRPGGGAPGQVGGVPVTVAPLPPERSEPRSGPPDHRAVVPGQIVWPGPPAQVAVQPGPLPEYPGHRGHRIARRDDLAGRNEDGLRAPGPRESGRRPVQPGQCRPGRVRVAQGPERRPRHRVPVAVGARRRLVNFVDRSAERYGAVAPAGA